MNKTKYLLALAALLSVIPSAQAGIKKIGTINGVDVYRVKTFSVFCPSTTTIVVADPKQPGTFSVINGGTGQGIVPAAANAGGLVGAAALLRPARTNVNNDSGSSAESNASAAGTGNATTTGGNKIPPGHINNPSGNH